MTILKLLLIIHIVLGSLSLLTGTYIISTKKGDKKHKLIGTIYFFAMLITAIIALPISIFHQNYFLFIISVFTSYMLLSGRRYINKKSKKNIKIFDWLLTIIMFLFALSFIRLGIFNILKDNLFGVVYIVFGSFGLLFVYQDYINFNGKSKILNFSLTTHLQRMIGSYVAAVTAFIVVNNKILPGIIAWLLPTLIVVPIIIIWTRKYKIVKTLTKKNTQ